ncbi:hypothetical protein P8C59_000803 [Phyllachora maydis]|uniref:Uncharacterized protein n=1 Tax=Phyllachora maydis TaxID=1825666 RepID=A0AAD9M6Z6_9PEZI|nr:hypothetical protein P8C59_000803 [Phyllachora maydis]
MKTRLRQAFLAVALADGQATSSLPSCDSMPCMSITRILRRRGGVLDSENNPWIRADRDQSPRSHPTETPRTRSFTLVYEV